MKHPRFIWLVYGLCLAIMLPSMGWLTHLAIRLDRDESLARALVQQEQDVREALWRMDATLTPILAQEVARPYFVYRSYYTPPTRDKSGARPRRVASPLLARPSELVLLHFQVGPDGAITSPQCPPVSFHAEAIGQGATVWGIAQSQKRLHLLQQAVKRDELLKQLPQQDLPPVDVGQLAWLAPAASPAIPGQAASRQQASVQPEPGTLDGSEPQGQQQVEQLTQQIIQGVQPSQIKSQARDLSGFETRNQVLQNLAQSERANQKFGLPASPSSQGTLVSEGVSQAFWAGPHLLMARRSRIGDSVFIQGCWLDWPRLSALLRQQVAEFLPAVDFLPVASGREVVSGRVLATLPVELLAPVAAAATQQLTLMRVALIVAWTCLLGAAAAFAILLAGMMRLSARQTAFVTAVTHELRTPLTTFRLYADLLADEMIPDREQRRLYLQTLRTEADRLSHLVANVLAYARLDGGRRCARSSVEVQEFVERVQGRLSERAALAGMQLIVELEPLAPSPSESDPQAPGSPPSTSFETDPLVLEQILFNLVDNAAKYAAEATDRRIHLHVERSASHVAFRVRDH